MDYGWDRGAGELSGAGRRVQFMLGMVIFLMILILMRFWFLQIVNQQYYLEIAENNRCRAIREPALRGEICDRYGILLVDEEVQTGFARTGRMFAIEHWGVDPDVLIVAKPIAAGLPMSAIIARAELMERWTAPAHLFTAEANPLACAAALAVLDVIEEENLPERAERLGEKALKRLGEMMESYELIGDVRGRGLLIGVDLVRSRETREPARAEAMKVCWRAWERGLVMISFGRFGNVLRIAPPLTITEEELMEGLDIVEASIRDVSEGRVPDSVLEKMVAW